MILNNFYSVAVIVIALTVSTSLSAQRGMLENAVGARFSFGAGVTYQRFITDRDVLEFMAMQRKGGISLTGLYEVHMQAFNVRGFKWYLGGGGHVNSYNGEVRGYEYLRKTTPVAGVDAIIGMEYFFRSAPVQVAVDWKPVFNLYNGRNKELDTGGFSIRYRF
ncbi:MAG: hypothetical protein RLZZ262_2626 [Bacteroidota bacterium]